MTSKRSGGKMRTRNSGRSARSLRLVLEPLESRRLLAGIQVSVYVDDNGSRGFEAAGDSPAANRLVYVDLNHSHAFDSGEPVQVTGPDGIAFFENLEPGDYSIGLLTNPATQPQVEPTSVANRTTPGVEMFGEQLIFNADLSRVWGMDNAGRVRPLVSPRGELGAELDLGGPVTASLMHSSGAAWLVHEGGSGQQLSILDLNSGRSSSQPLLNLAAGEVLSGLVETSNGVVGLVTGRQATRLAQVEVGQRGAVLVQSAPIVASQIVGNPASPQVIAIGQYQSFTSLQLIEPGAESSSRQPMLLQDVVHSAAMSADGKLLLLTTDAGVKVMSLAAGNIALQAVLSEAAGPLSANSVDGRVITANIRNPHELIVWDSNSWLPIGRVQSLGSSMQQIISSQRGDSAILSTRSSLELLDLAVARLQPVSLAGGQSQASVRLGVQSLGNNTPPDVSRFQRRTLKEDSVDNLDWQAAGVADVDGDTLWVTLSTPARHGVLNIASDGTWKYTPRPDFSGSDSAVVSVHDGQTATKLQVHWNVTPVNDPPISISVETRPLAENSPPGTELGFVSIVDADRDASYRVVVSDPRMTVDRGRIFLSQGEVDFESEPTLAVQIIAIDQTDPSIRIETTARFNVLDVNEAPRAISLSSLSIPENAPGFTVGSILVEDPEGDEGFEFLVSDPRFFVDGNQIRLRDDQSLNFEQEPVVRLQVSARDTLGSFEKAADFALSVLDVDDPPTELRLSRVEVQEYTDGAAVGELLVVDEDGGAYDFSVSDSRFEVVDHTLKLRDGVQLSSDETRLVELTVVATNRSGKQLSNGFSLLVVPPRSPWQNPVNPHDVNDDGLLTPIDVLVLINMLNKDGARPLPVTGGGGGGGGEGPATRPDVNGDGMLSPVDVLILINELNRNRSGAEGEASLPPTQFSNLQGQAQPPESEFERRRRADSEIDAELEILLDQIHRQL